MEKRCQAQNGECVSCIRSTGNGKKPSAAHKQAPFHMIYDIEIDFKRKARLVAEGCRTPNPVTITYAG